MGEHWSDMAKGWGIVVVFVSYSALSHPSPFFSRLLLVVSSPSPSSPPSSSSLFLFLPVLAQLHAAPAQLRVVILPKVPKVQAGPPRVAASRELN